MNTSTNGTAFVGADAVNLYRAIALKHALKLYAASGIQASRGLSPTGMLALATQYTAKAYKRGQYALAAQDLGQWIEAKKADRCECE